MAIYRVFEKRGVVLRFQFRRPQIKKCKISFFSLQTDMQTTPRRLNWILWILDFVIWGYLTPYAQPVTQFIFLRHPVDILVWLVGGSREELRWEWGGDRVSWTSSLLSHSQNSPAKPPWETCKSSEDESDTDISLPGPTTERILPWWPIKWKSRPGAERFPM